MFSHLCEGSRSVRRVLLLGALGVLAGPQGCADEAPVRRTTHALGAAQTTTFQDGANSYAGAADTALSQNAPATNSGSATTLSVDGDDPGGSGKDAAILLRWDLSSIPAGSVVQSVSLTVRVVDASTNSYPILALRRTWSESSATWTSARTGVAWQTAGAQDATDREAAALGAITAAATGTVQVTLNATGVAKVQQWIDDPAQNAGVIFASATNTNGLDIASSEHATVSFRPALTVSYQAPSAASGGASGSGGTGGLSPPDAAADLASNSGGSGPLEQGEGGAGGAGPPDAAPDIAASGGAIGSGGSASGGAPGSGGAGSGGAPGSGGAGSGGAAGDSEPPQSAVLFAVGDVGDCDTTADTETANLLDGSSDPIALLGDIGYPNGSASDLANCFGQPWGRHKSRVRPAPGNHEYLTSGASAYFQYFGDAAGTAGKGYYSYAVGDWHVIALNSNCSKVSCSAGSAQEQWLRQDLAAHPAACTIAYWHHPRYNSGHHGNATNMTAIWKALMDFNADVVLTGHEHGYQRWKPMNQSTGQVANGITQFIVGTGGTDLVPFTNSKPANVIVRDATSPGILKLTLHPGAYDWTFLPIAGSTFTDQGTASCH